jgi:hypothetical protein
MIEIVDFRGTDKSMRFDLDLRPGLKPNTQEKGQLATKPHLDTTKVTVDYMVAGDFQPPIDLDKWDPAWDPETGALTLKGFTSGETWPHGTAEAIRLKVLKSSSTWDLRAPASAGMPGDLETVAGFPILVESMTYPQPSTPGPADDLQGMVDRKLAVVLGGAARNGNPKGIVAALKRAFSESDVDGVTTWAWNPTSSIGMSDVGASVTGMQASLAALGTSSLTVVEPLLEGLTPLVLSDSFNPDKIDTERAIVKSSWRALVDELGADGGPRSVRVDTLTNEAGRALVALGKELGVVPKETNGAKTTFSKFDQIATTRTYVVLPADETTLTNYVIIVDQMRTVADRWTTYFDAVKGGKPVDVGAAVVLLERRLSVVSESVSEVTSALDSVFVGPAERAARRFDLKFTDSGGKPAKGDLSITDVLSWIDDFGSREAPETLQESGKTGVPLVRATSATLESLARELRAVFLTKSGALGHPRVRTATQELITSLGDVRKAARDLEDVYKPDTKTPAAPPAAP